MQERNGLEVVGKGWYFGGPIVNGVTNVPIVNNVTDEGSVGNGGGDSKRVNGTDNPGNDTTDGLRNGAERIGGKWSSLAVSIGAIAGFLSAL